jgi:hypothetical protein
VFHGATVQKMFTSSGTHDAGVFQTVAVEPGTRLRVSVWGKSWSSDCDDPCISPQGPCREGSSNSHGSYRVSIGVDQAGGPPPDQGAPAPDTVLWSDPLVFESYDHWYRLSLDAMALSDHVTVYTRGHPVWPVKHNDSYWDDARLEITARPGDLAHWAYVPLGLLGGFGEPGRQAEATAHAPAPPGADIRIEYPIRAYPGQENFNLPTCDDLDFESVLLKNHGEVDVSLGGWKLTDADGNAYVFPEVVMKPGDRVRLWTTSGPDTTDGTFTDLYWNRAEDVWNGPGPTTPFDVATLYDDARTEVARRGYP